MARAPGGKSVGRVSIRVVPDSSRFREDLRKALNRIEKTEFLSIKPELDSKGRAKFAHDVRKMVQDASGNKVRIGVAASTAAATAQLRYVSRARVVPLRVSVSKVSLARAATLIASLSGARVAANWVEDLSRSIGNIDKNLPKIGLVTSSISSLVSVLLASVSGLVGIGAGLTAILPALLVLPGLFAGLVTSAAILVVALADAKTQLADLGPSMTELRDIIREGFWSQARQPILDLVNNLMPQLRNSFRNTSAAIGGFIGGLASSFEKEFANGRFEQIFAGMKSSFAILTTGTDGFAGALVSLFLVAANYVPRLSQWFVDIANRFDAWLKTTAEDGRLAGWIDGAIVAMDDLWRATKATGRLLSGIWKAAEAAGGGGLKGFADNMERIAAAVNGPAFQRTLIAIFQGAQKATGGLNIGLRALGHLLEDQRAAIEYFLGRTGIILGLFIRDIANALNTPAIAKGLTAFIDGLSAGFASFGEYLPQVSTGLAALAEFAGELARQLGPVLGATLAGLAGVLTPLLDFFRTEVLPTLGPALQGAIETISPSLATLAESLGPILEDLADLVEFALPLAAEAIASFADGFAAQADGIAGTSDRMKNDIFSAFGELVRASVGTLQLLGDLIAGNDVTVEAALGNYGLIWQDTQNTIYHIVEDIKGFFRDLAQNAETAWLSLKTTIDLRVTEAIATVTSFGQSLRDVFVGAGQWLYSAGRDIIQGLINGVNSMIGSLLSTFSSIGNQVLTRTRQVFDQHSPSKKFEKIGRLNMAGLETGHKVGVVQVADSLKNILNPVDLVGGIDLSGLSAAGGSQTNYQVSFPIIPERGIPLADQMFHASRRLRARLAS